MPTPTWCTHRRVLPPACGSRPTPPHRPSSRAPIRSPPAPSTAPGGWRCCSPPRIPMSPSRATSSRRRSTCWRAGTSCMCPTATASTGCRCRPVHSVRSPACRSRTPRWRGTSTPCAPHCASARPPHGGWRSPTTSTACGGAPRRAWRASHGGAARAGWPGCSPDRTRGTTSPTCSRPPGGAVSGRRCSSSAAIGTPSTAHRAASTNGNGAIWPPPCAPPAARWDCTDRSRPRRAPARSPKSSHHCAARQDAWTACASTTCASATTKR